MIEEKHLLALANQKMPFGKHAGKVLMDVPEEYLLWLADKGLPEGPLGQLLALLLNIKTHGQERVLEPLRGMKGPMP